MRYLVIIKDYFSFNQKELSGIFVLLTLIFMILLANIFVDHQARPEKFDTREFERDIMTFEKAMHEQDSLEKEERKQHYHHQYPAFAGKGYDSAGGLRYPEKPVLKIELNSADSFALQQLRGIGPAFARRIIRYRDRLGGFISKTQVMEVFGMDTGRYNAIAGNLFVNTDSVRKINLNTATFKELLSHPYFQFETAKSIMLYRKEKKKITGIEELRSVKGIADTTFRKILPYIRTQ